MDAFALFQAHFRLFGPGAKWEQARQAILDSQEHSFVGHRLTALDDGVEAGRHKEDHKRPVNDAA